MLDFIMLMHDDAASTPTGEAWAEYFAILNQHGAFCGGSSIGPGETLRRNGDPAPPSDMLVGYIRILADDLAAAKALAQDNPHFALGGTVELRNLPRD